MATAPALFIARQKIADRWDWDTEGDLIALADISIPWGRERITDAPTGHVATVRLIDTDTTLRRWDLETLIGIDAAVHRQGDGIDIVLLAGIVTAHTSQALTVSDPLTGRLRQVVQITLTISDTFASLSLRSQRGPSNGIQIYGQGGVPIRRVAGPFGFGGWETQLNSDRLRILAPLIKRWLPTVQFPRATLPSPSDHPDSTDTAAPAQPVQMGIPADTPINIGEMLRRCYASTSGLGWPRIIPGTRIEQGEPQTAGAIRLRTGTSAASTVWLDAENASVTAKDLGIPDERAFPSADIGTSIISVSTLLDRHAWTWQERLVDSTGQEVRKEQLIDDDTSTTLRATVNNSQSTKELTLDVGASASTVWPPLDGKPVVTQRDSPQSKAAANAALALILEAAARVELLNGWLELPKLVYTPPRDGTEASTLLQTWDTDAIYIAGSKWHGMRRVPRTVQIIGGTLTWDADGWRHELTTAPTIDTRPRDLTLGILLDFENPIASFDARLTLADLSAVTERTPQ